MVVGLPIRSNYISVPDESEVPNYWARTMIDDVDVAQATRVRALAIADLTDEEIYREHGYIPRTAEIRLINAIVAEMVDPYFAAKAPLRARRRQGSFLFYLILHCANLREALDAVERYLFVIRPTLAVSITEQDDEVEVIIEAEGRKGGPQMAVWGIAALVATLRMAVAREDLPREIHIVDTLPADIDGWSTALGVTIRDGMPQCRMAFSREQAEYPIFSADGELKRYLLAVAETMRDIAGDRGGHARHKVELALVDLLPRGTTTLAHVAGELGVSVRSLQRGLAQEGVTFATVLGETRQRMAIDYLADDKMPLAHIALMLGYTDQSAFSRAFKAMTGFTPGVYRRSITPAA
jgi:AraC-like DNA-binding protein